MAKTLNPSGKLSVDLPADKQLYTVQEAANFLQTSRFTLYSWIKQGLLPAQLPSPSSQRGLIIARTELERFRRTYQQSEGATLQRRSEVVDQVIDCCLVPRAHRKDSNDSPVSYAWDDTRLVANGPVSKQASSTLADLLSDQVRAVLGSDRTDVRPTLVPSAMKGGGLFVAPALATLLGWPLLLVEETLGGSLLVPQPDLDLPSEYYLVFCDTMVKDARHSRSCYRKIRNALRRRAEEHGKQQPVIKPLCIATIYNYNFLADPNGASAQISPDLAEKENQLKGEQAEERIIPVVSLVTMGDVQTYCMRHPEKQITYPGTHLPLKYQDTFIGESF